MLFNFFFHFSFALKNIISLFQLLDTNTFLFQNTGYRGPTAAEPRRNFEYIGQGVKSSTYSDRNVRRIGYSRNALPGKVSYFYASSLLPFLSIVKLIFFLGV